jgi:hypothetical protein
LVGQPVLASVDGMARSDTWGARIPQGRVTAHELEQLTHERLQLCAESLEAIARRGALPPADAFDLAQLIAVLAVTAHDVNVLATHGCNSRAAARRHDSLGQRTAVRG